VSRERLVSDPAMAVPGDRVRQLQDAVRRRAVAREPVAYIIGRRAFRRLELRVDPRVLVPRPETESLVEAAIELLPRGARVLDVGTGSGAIALALRDERPDLSVSGGDVSEAALEVARANGELLGLDVRWVHCDLLQGAPADLDAVVANLPYVATGERTRLAPEIVRHEPPAALFAGGDGLATIRALCNQLGERPLVRRALLEVGEGQAAAVGALLQEAGFFDVAVRRDLAGIERILAATRRT
jgi:release factor glutamine methyltransferase